MGDMGQVLLKLPWLWSFEKLFQNMEGSNKYYLFSFLYLARAITVLNFLFIWAMPYSWQCSRTFINYKIRDFRRVWKFLVNHFFTWYDVWPMVVCLSRIILGSSHVGGNTYMQRMPMTCNTFPRIASRFVVSSCSNVKLQYPFSSLSLRQSPRTLFFFLLICNW